MLWWRDDDAIEPTPRLERLIALAAEMPLALAVIPALARPELAEALADLPRVAVLQHGWQHANRGKHGKKSEYPEGRAAAAVAAEIGAGRARLNVLFGRRALPIFVPPWNRLASEFLPLLPAAGIAALSAIPPRQSTAMPRGLARIDVHLDLVAWAGARGFIGETAALGALIRCLQARRCGAEAADRPVGILTHHLVMDGATVAFLERLIALTGAHRAARWAAVTDLL